MTVRALVCRIRSHVPWVQAMLPNGMWVDQPDHPAEWTYARLTTRLVCRRCRRPLPRF